jgi:predicted short-subunit dehydrogenase-like oxidoreductase (DUF2520 family)
LAQISAISIVGFGAVGQSLARAFKKAGLPLLSVVGRGRAGERRLTRELKVECLSGVAQLDQNQGIIVLAVRDDQIADLARSMARLDLRWKRLTVLHTSGSLASAVLAPLDKAGAGVAAWHPFQTFLKVRPAPLNGVTFGIDGNPRGVRSAFALSRAVGGKPLKIAARDRVPYHLSAVLACGFIATDMQMAERVLKSLGLSDSRVREAILPIAEQTMLNVRALGPRKAMTGPAVRGDRATIRKHLAALKKLDPKLAKVYSEVTTYILDSTTIVEETS